MDITEPCIARSFPAGSTIDHWQAPDGWPLRRLIWPAPNGAAGTEPARGSILFLGGRGDHFEKYLESFADWSARGWQVESVDWRGQGGSGRLSDDPNVGHVEDFSLWIADIAAYAADWRARTPGPHVMMGHSMGGHLLMRALAEHGVTPDAAILIAPMLGFIAPYPDWLGHQVAQWMTRIGRPERAAWKASEKPGSSPKLRQTLLTHDDARYADELWWHAQNPAIVLGPPSWRWVERAYASIIGLSQPGVLETIDVPLLILATKGDKLVSASAAARDAKRVASAQLHVYGRDAAHELLREVDAVRNDALRRIDAFLDEAAPKL